MNSEDGLRAGGNDRMCLPMAHWGGGPRSGADGTGGEGPPPPRWVSAGGAVGEHGWGSEDSDRVLGRWGEGSVAPGGGDPHRAGGSRWTGRPLHERPRRIGSDGRRGTRTPAGGGGGAG